MLVWMEGEASSVHRTPKNLPFAWFITHTATTHIFVHAHVLFLDKTVHTSSSTLHSYCSKIIGHFGWRCEQVTLEAGFTISIVAEIHLRCIRRTTVPWPYELRLGSMTCKNDPQRKFVSFCHTLLLFRNNFGGRKWLAELSFG